MGRNSVDATKASLMRAVRARRAALTVGLTGVLAVLLVRLAVFAVFLLFWTGFFFAVMEDCPVGLVAGLLDVCPATGNATIK
jgi:hypothetical protein